MRARCPWIAPSPGPRLQLASMANFKKRLASEAAALERRRMQKLALSPAMRKALERKIAKKRKELDKVIAKRQKELAYLEKQLAESDTLRSIKK